MRPTNPVFISTDSGLRSFEPYARAKLGDNIFSSTAFVNPLLRVRSIAVCIFLALTLCFISDHTSLYAQPGTIDDTFNPMDLGMGIGDGANNTIQSLVVQPDGKIIIVGAFTSYNGTGRLRIARLNADGSLDTSFNPFGGANSTIRTLALQPDGKIIIGGQFTSYTGTARSRIARLNANGSLDTGFNPGTGVVGFVDAIAVQPDGKILIGGSFTSYNGITRNRIARLNSDGSLDTGFDPGTGANNSVLALAVQPDGKILIGGAFTSFNSTGRNRIALLNTDGSLDTGFNPGTGASSAINVLAIQPDGKILIGGSLTSYNGTTRNRIARLNDNGSLDASFNPSTGASGTIASLGLQSDGKIIIGGVFTSYNGTGRNRIARLNTDGSLDVGFDPGTGASSTVRTLAVQSDGKIVIGGDLTTYNATVSNRIGRLNTDGSIDMTFNPSMGANSIVRALAFQPDGKILIGGDFTGYNGAERNRIARLNADGSIDTGFNPGTGANSVVRTIAVQPDGKILIGGDFAIYNGTSRGRIARLNSDGSLDTGFDPGTGAGGALRGLAVQPDGKILIGGFFTSYNGTTRNRIARLNADGSLDTDFNPGTGASGLVRAFAVQPDGKILIGGDFTSYNGTGLNRIARLNTDGSLDTDFNPGTGASSTVRAFYVLPDGKILIVGAFTSYNGTGRNRIARLNADGTLDMSFNPGAGATATVMDIAVQPDEKIIIGGLFTSYNNMVRFRIARLNADGSLDTDFDPGTGGNSLVRELAVQPDDKVLIGGEFTSYDGTGRNRVARVNGAVSCPNPGDLVITEIMRDPDSPITEANGEWFEVYNTTATPIDMQGIEIKDDGTMSVIINSSVVVPAGGYVVLMRNGDTAVNGGITADYVYGTGFQLANGEDEIVLVCGGAEIDRVNYDDNEDFPDNEGSSMSLDPAFQNATDNDDGNNWCNASTSYTTNNSGTPGTANPSCCGPGEDNVAPVVSCTATANVTLNLCGEANLTLADLGVSVTDNCPDALTVTIDPATITTVGTTNVTITASDGVSTDNSCVVAVTTEANPDAFTIMAMDDDLGTSCGTGAFTFTETQLIGNDNISTSDPLEVQEVELVDDTQGTLVDNGDGTYTFTPATNFTGTVDFTYLLTKDGNDQFFSDNGHFYQFVSAADISWEDARIAAEGMMLNGLTGYLATITSQAENDFIFDLLLGNGWIGANDAATEGVWQWVTGPETGNIFFGPGAIPGAFVNWGPGEPNDFGGDEDYGHIVATGSPFGAPSFWNDVPNTVFAMAGYVVEYSTEDGCIPVLTDVGNITLEIAEKPVITTQPMDETVCTGEDATYEVAATGTGLSYQWQQVCTEFAPSWAVNSTTSGPNNFPSSNFVYDIAFEGGTTYLATFDGVAILPPGASSWTVYNSTSGPSGFPSTDDVRGIAVDGGTIYIGTNNGGLGVLPPGASSWTVYTTMSGPTGFPNNIVRSVFVDGGTIYAGTDAGVAVLPPGASSWTTYTFLSGVNNIITDIKFIDGTIYAATAFGGLGVLPLGAPSWTVYSTSSGPSGFPDNEVNEVAVIDGTIYAATESGLAILPPGASSWTVYRTSSGPSGFPNNDLRSVKVEGGTIYVATFGGGLAVLQPGASSWTVYSDIVGPSGFPENQVFEVAINESGLYAGTAGGGLAVLAGNQVVTDAGTNSNSYTFTPATADAECEYQVIITNSDGCSVTSEAAQLSVNPTPDIAPIATQMNSCPTADFDLTTLTVMDNNNVLSTTTTFHTTAPSSATDNVTQLTGAGLTIDSDQTIFVRVATTTGCFDVTSFMVDIVACCDIVLPVPTVTNETCAGDNDGSITAAATCTTCANIEYTLSGDASVGPQANGNFTGLAPGNYTVTATDTGDGTCTASQVVMVAAAGPLPTITASANPSSACEGTSVQISSSASGGLGATASDSPGSTIPRSNDTYADNLLTLNGSGTVAASSEVKVTLNITHRRAEDVDAYLVGPGNCGALELFTDVGGGGDNFTNTVLSTGATNIIGTTGNNSAPFSGTFRPEGDFTMPPSYGGNAATTGVTTSLIGCPVSGDWTLKLIDDQTGTNGGVLQSWSLSISPNGTVPSFTLSAGGSNIETNENGVFNVDPAIGFSEYTIDYVGPDGCSGQTTTSVDIFDLPDITDIATTCANSDDGTITVTASIDNSNFTGSDIGSVEYSFDGGATWGSDATATGLSVGVYQIGVRNSAATDCATNFTPVTISGPIAANDVQVCTGAPSPLTEPLSVVDDCDPVFESMTVTAGTLDANDPTYAKSSNENSYVAGMTVSYDAVSIRPGATGDYRIESCGFGFNGSLSIYTAPFDPANPGINFIRMDDDGYNGGSGCAGGDDGAFGTNDSRVSLDVNQEYVLVIQGEQAGQLGDWEIRFTDGPAAVFVGEPAQIEWYDAPTGGNLVGTGMTFDPTVATADNTSPVSTAATGTFTYYAACAGSDCDRATATLTITEAAVTTETTSPVCEGETIQIGGTTTGFLAGTATNLDEQNLNGCCGTPRIKTFNLAGAGTVDADTEILVELNIDHTRAQDVDIFLVGPADCGALTLFTDVGGNGNNFENTLIATNALDVIGSPGFNSPPFTGIFAPEGDFTMSPDLSTAAGVQPNQADDLPTTSLLGCPVSGEWSLVIFDDQNGDSGEFISASVSVGDAFTTHVLEYVSGPDNVFMTTNLTGLYEVSPSVGEHTYTLTSSGSGCSAMTGATAKVFDFPVFGSAAIVCDEGSGGAITATADLDNSNFTGADLGVVEFSLDGGAWVMADESAMPNLATYSTTFSGLSAGTYRIEVRNSASTDCAVEAGVFTVTSTATTQDYNVCIDETVPTGEGLTATNTCPLSYSTSPVSSFTGDIDGSEATIETSSVDLNFNNQNNVFAPFAGTGNSVPFETHFFQVFEDGTYSFQSCASGTTNTYLAIYSLPFDPTTPSVNYVESDQDDCTGGNQNARIRRDLAAGTDYVLVVGAEGGSGTYTVDVSGDAGLYEGLEQTIAWYDMETGGNLVGEGDVFNPTLMTALNTSPISTGTPGTTTFYAACSSAQGDCRVPAVFTVNTQPTVTITADPTGDICLGTTVEYTAMVTPAAPADGNYTFEWCAYNGSNGFGPCNGGFSDDDALITTRSWTASSGDKSVGFAVSAPGCPELEEFYNFNIIPDPTVSAVTQVDNPTCAGSDTDFSLSGLLENATLTINYTIGTDAYIETGVTSDASGNATFTVAGTEIDATDHNASIEITSITVTEFPTGTAVPNCIETFAGVTFTLQVNELPSYTVTADPAGDICLGTSVQYDIDGLPTLNVGSSYSFFWSAYNGPFNNNNGPNDGFNDRTLQNPTRTWNSSPGDKSVGVVVSTPGCPDVEVGYDFNVNSNPTANNTTLTVCEDAAGSGQGDFTLTDAEDVMADANTGGVDVDGGAMGVTVTYYATPADAEGGTATNEIEGMNLTAADSPIFARVENDATGCFSIAEVSLVINTAPQADIRPFQQFPFNQVCVGEQARFVTTPSAAGPPAVTSYNWMYSGSPTVVDLGQTATDGSGKNQGVTYSAADAGMQTVDLTIVYANGCTSTAPQHSITVNSLPVVEIQNFQQEPFAVLCSGEAGTYLANIANPNPGGNVNVYEWSVTPSADMIIPQGQDGDVSGTRNVEIEFPLNTGTTDVMYTVNLMLEDANGCVNTDDQIVTVKPTPTIACPTVAPQCPNADPIDLTTLEYSESPTGGTFTFAGPGVSGMTFDPSVAGVGMHMITVTYTASNNCETTCTFNIEVFSDVDPPTFTCPADRMVTTDDACMFDVPDLVSEVTPMDNCAGPFTITQDPIVGTTLMANSSGPVSVLVTVTDAAGNPTSCNVTLSIPPSCEFPLEITNNFEAGDPCSCNDDQGVNNQAGDGTFSETVTVTGQGGFLLRVRQATGILGVSLPAPLTETSDGVYEITFNHQDRTGYVITEVEFSTDGGATWNLALESDGTTPIAVSNTCAYPVIRLEPDLLSTYCQTATPITLGAAFNTDIVNPDPIFEDPAADETTFTIDGQPVMTFDASTLSGSVLLQATYAPLNGPSVNGTVTNPAIAIDANSCPIILERMIEILEVNCGTFPWDGN